MINNKVKQTAKIIWPFFTKLSASTNLHDAEDVKKIDICLNNIVKVAYERSSNERQMYVNLLEFMNYISDSIAQKSNNHGHMFTVMPETNEEGISCIVKVRYGFGVNTKATTIDCIAAFNKMKPSTEGELK